ncbi:MAG TPA: hypothetical protein VGD71_32615 [Kribbella sp.]|jgi:hypothetical protein
MARRADRCWYDVVVGGDQVIGMAQVVRHDLGFPVRDVFEKGEQMSPSANTPSVAVRW